MKNKVLIGFAAIAMVVILASCGKVPQAQIDATNAAIEAAKAAEANVYLPAEFAAVQDSRNAEMVEENNKLVPKLPRGKEGAAVIEQIKADLANVGAAVTEAQGAFDKGAFMDALN